MVEYAIKPNQTKAKSGLRRYNFEFIFLYFLNVRNVVFSKIKDDLYCGILTFEPGQKCHSKVMHRKGSDTF